MIFNQRVARPICIVYIGSDYTALANYIWSVLQLCSKSLNAISTLEYPSLISYCWAIFSVFKFPIYYAFP